MAGIWSQFLFTELTCLTLILLFSKLDFDWRWEIISNTVLQEINESTKIKFKYVVLISCLSSVV